MSQNVVWWVGVKNPTHTEKYGNYDYFEYSRKSWEFWCRQNDILFVAFDEPVKKDLIEYRINWQKILFVFDELERRDIDYDQICLVDSSSIIKWDCPNFFNMTDGKFTAIRDMDNMKWIYDSIQGYKTIFDNYELDIKKYFSSGFLIFNSSHRLLINKFKDFYESNKVKLIDLQDNLVKRGNDQTPLNFWLQINNVNINMNLSQAFKVTHLHRKELFQYNWQTGGDDKTPHFLKYCWIWFFNGFDKSKRTEVMKQTWEMIKDNYK